jgi:PAS domain S-box-containing protein
MLAMFSDITGLKTIQHELKLKNEQLEKAYALLKESDERFRQLAENIDDIFWLSEGEQVLYLNSAVERKFGFSRSVISKNIQAIGKFIHPEDLQVYDQLARLKYQRQSDPVEKQLRVIDQQGQVRWVWARLFPILNEKNEPFRIAGIVSDITLQKNIEFELMTAKEKAQESDQLKSAFLANLSHEIRTPLNGILGFSHLLTREETEAALRSQYIEIINKSSDQLLHIIDDLVDISKIEARQMRIIQQSCNLNQLLDDLYHFYVQALKKQEKTTLELSRDYQLPDDESDLITDEYRLRQVLMNLLSNAVKFTEKGHIRFGYCLENPETLRFFVEDTGIGIAPDMANLVFEPFRQADGRSTREYGGAGLGLSICRGLVNLLGGSIWLNSKPGLGSTFNFTLPFRSEKANEIPIETALSPLHDLQWKNKTILIVEDDELNYKYLNEVLAPTGLNITLACNGMEAVDLASRGNFDLILMDIRLPVMNGLEAIRKIRESGNPVPIIAQTAYAMTEDKKTCMEAGCSDYIAKPVMQEMLLKKIGFYLGKK